ncbi:MAG: apolipoprotein N-acyltransferase [Candidatus Nanopelagicales bacterium]|nr:apolipoprotein N-acyltransferase [Candidatus Nanopelagicales bacterium]
MDPHVSLRWLAAVGAGVAMALAFPPIGLWPLAPIGVAVLTWAVAGRRGLVGFGLGSASGLTFFLVLVRWITVIGVDAWILLAAYSALWLGLVAWATAIVVRLPGWPLFVAAIWVAEEALRDRIPLGGWPWGRLAHSQADSPLLPLAWLGGSPLLTAAVAGMGACLTGIWFAVRRGVPLHAFGAAAVIAVLLFGGLLLPVPVSGESDGGPADATIAVIQGNVPRTGLNSDGQRRAVLENHVRQTQRLADDVAAGLVPAPEAVIWPENAADSDPLADGEARAAIDGAVDLIAVPVLVGAVIANPREPSTVLNVGIVWSPNTGPGQMYVKQHPVPFGEYIPFRAALASLISRFDQIPHDFAAGTESGVLDVGPVRLGDVICFEIAYDDLVRETVVDGARMIAVQTNNATYTGTGQTEQQLAMARIQSVSHGRTVAVAATNGISAVFLPDGTRIGQIPEDVAWQIVARVPLRDSLTPGDVLGLWPEGIALVVSVLTVALGLRRPRGVWPAAGSGITPQGTGQSRREDS